MKKQTLIRVVGFVIPIVFACGIGIPSVSSGQTLVLSEYNNGNLTWTNSGSGLEMYTVQWTSEIGGEGWFSDWGVRKGLVTDQSELTIDVPMFYRVAEGFNNRAFDGVWIVYGDGHTYIKSDGEGLVLDFGAFYEANPPGYYSVTETGSYDLVLYEKDRVEQISGHRLDAFTWQYVYEGMTGIIRRVDDVDALSGEWDGTIGPYSNVMMVVREDGYAPGISNIINSTVGSMFVDGSNSVAGFFYTGADSSNPWNRFQLSGTLVGGTNIVGDVQVDSDVGWYSNAVDLIRDP